jgi:threonine/homoserine/homoserine lactone efflux protein
MNTANLAVFAMAYLAVLVLPGPGVTALIARVLARGTQGIPAFIGGFVAGALIWFTIAATGLAALAAAFSTVFVAIRYLCAAYLLYLAWKFWTAAPRPMNIADAQANTPDGYGRLFLTGLAINLGNPKVILFFLALLPTVVDVKSLTPLGYAELAMIIIVIASTVLAAYALAAGRARRLFNSTRAARLLNRGSGVVMAGAAAAIAMR